jgi:hypothetical protein
MHTSDERPVAFYHRDGLVAAWNHATRYAGKGGHIATLPEIVELRLGAKPGTKNSPWEKWYTSASAEYLGVGADGRVKIIVAHGVGPMSTISGIKAVYRWEYGDKSRRRNGGRITAQQFLDLESGQYGNVKVISPKDLQLSGGRFRRKFDVAPVNVLDFEDYLADVGKDAFVCYLTAAGALRDPLMRMRLGSNSYRYLMRHEQAAKTFHRTRRPNRGRSWAVGFDDRSHPYITKVDDASNCGYLRFDTRDASGIWTSKPRVPEDGFALAHLLDIHQFVEAHTAEVGAILLSSPGVHGWRDGARFIALPPFGRLDSGLADGPDPSKVLHEHWEHFMEPVEENFSPIVPFLLEREGDEWFACYPKKFPEDHCMDDGDLEFHATSVERVGEPGTFIVNEDFFLRYKLAQVKAIMPRTANAYQIVDIGTKAGDGQTTVTVVFYRADVDLSRRLPRTKDLARDYDRLMEVYAR